MPFQIDKGIKELPIMERAVKEATPDKPPPAQKSERTGTGVEEWLKRASICLALLYVNGYAAFKAYAGAFGLGSKDFGLDEKDYVMQGISFLILNSESVVYPRWDYLVYYLMQLLTWLIMYFGIYLAFARISKDGKRSTVIYALLLGFAFLG